MRTIWNLKLVAAAVVMAGAAVPFGGNTASAVPLVPAATVAPVDAASHVEQVQYYGYGRRYYRPRYNVRPGYYGGRYYGRGYYGPRRYYAPPYYGPRLYGPRRFYGYY